MKNENSVYVFSGLGADERVFKKIKFENCEPIFIQWKRPKNEETLKEYAKRIANNIIGEKIYLIGISFGGIVAQEVVRIIKTEKVILLATIESRDELPLYLKIGSILQLDRIIPTKLLKTKTKLTELLFGTQTIENGKLLREILNETNGKFLKWALRQIATWKGEENNFRRVTIHGEKDLILPISQNKNYNYRIKKGGHFFTLTNEKELTEILNKEIKTE